MSKKKKRKQRKSSLQQKPLLQQIQEAVRSQATSLNLSNNQLSDLPEEIGYLHYNADLQSLDLSSNRLSSLPWEIGQLTNLQSLNLSSNRLSSLLGAIGQLTNLRSLDLRNNQLSHLPGEIRQLTNLRSLDLRNNQLSRLPPEIRKYLDNPQEAAREIPRYYRQLLEQENERQIKQKIREAAQSQATSLNFSGNQLSSLPEEIGQLSNLRSLDLKNNQLSSLPPEIRKYLDNPQEAARKIPRYYRQVMEQDTERLYEAKLLIVGEGGAGKTSLAKKIEDEHYEVPNPEASTEGIDIIQWQFPLQNDKEFRVNIWDFGGQEIYHTTHQFFLTKRSLYILVAENRKEHTDFYYWLNVVKLLSDNSPVLIVKNEKKNQQLNIPNEQQLRGEFANWKESLPTNLADNNRGLDTIKRKIQHHISELPHVGDELPKTWVRVRRALEANPRNYITLDNYLQICQENGFTCREDALQLSDYLHDLGVCLHFQKDDLLGKTVILKPTWGTDAVYKVLNDRQVNQNLGKFTREDLANIWNEEKYANMRPELLRLMLNFKLCYEIPGSPNTYIAPQLLSPKQPEYTWNEDHNLLLRYSYEFMPKGILTRFIVEMHRWIEKQTYVWRTGVILKKDKARAEVIELYYRKQIHIRVCGQRPRDLLTAIRHELDKIHHSFENRLKYRTQVPCNCQACKGKQDPHFYDFKKLEERIANGKETIECGNPPYHNVGIAPLIDDVTSGTMSQQPSSPSTRNQVFISYSHRDAQWLTELQTHLKPYIRNQLISKWDDGQIQPGAEWCKEIEKALATAKVALLLVSPNFLCSDFIDKEELPPLLEAAEEEGLTIFWIPISDSAYKITPIEKYQAAHPPDVPLDDLSPSGRNKAWVKICEKLYAAFTA